MKKWSATFRIWHWLFALTIIFMSLTVLMRETILDKHTNAVVIADGINLLYDANVTNEDATDIAKDISRPLWKWHIVGGYLFSALLLLRFALFATQSGKRNYINCKEKSTHKKLISGVYAVLYFFALIVALTGLGMKFGEELGFDDTIHHTLKEIHEFAFYAILAYMALHIGGVVVAENKDEQGIVSDMINGGKE